MSDVRLIDANAYEYPGDLIHMPTIDAVPVVRCRECKYARPLEQDGFVACIMWCRAMHSKGFCY